MMISAARAKSIWPGAYFMDSRPRDYHKRDCLPFIAKAPENCYPSKHEIWHDDYAVTVTWRGLDFLLNDAGAVSTPSIRSQIYRLWQRRLNKWKLDQAVVWLRSLCLVYGLPTGIRTGHGLKDVFLCLLRKNLRSQSDSRIHHLFKFLYQC
jgi:hypothetical protein